MYLLAFASRIISVSFTHGYNLEFKLNSLKIKSSELEKILMKQKCQKPNDAMLLSKKSQAVWIVF